MGDIVEDKEQEVLPTKKKQVWHKEISQDIITAMGDKGNYKQFKYLTYRERTRKIQHILSQILSICVNMKEFKLSGYDFLICNVDLAKDALAFTQLLELRL